MIINPVHNSRLNSFTWAGINIHEGLAPDGYMNITYKGDRTSSVVDAGSASVSTSALADRSAIIEIVLLQQSNANLALSSITRREDIQGTPVIHDMDIEEGGTVYLYKPRLCHIQASPAQSIAADVSGATQTWTFHCAYLEPKDIDSFLNVNADARTTIKGEVEAAIEVSLSI